MEQRLCRWLEVQATLHVHMYGWLYGFVHVRYIKPMCIYVLPYWTCQIVSTGSLHLLFPVALSAEIICWLLIGTQQVLP